MKKNLFTLFFSAAYLVSYTQPGTPDPTFGTAGVVTTTFGPIQAASKSMAIQSDGKIVMAGYHQSGSASSFAVSRYNTNGTPDNTFDGDGKLTTVIGVNDDEANAIAVQSDGKIVVAGRSHVIGSPNQFALVRYNPNGMLDNSFSGDGKVVTNIGSSDAVAYAIVIQPDGKIVLAGNSFNGSNTDFALARYNVDGSLDNSFDSDGKLTTPVSSSYDDAFSIALQTDGKIVVVGNCGIPASSDFAIVRYSGLDGSLDSSFNGTGKVITIVNDASDEVGLAIQTDGKLLIAGSDGANFITVRYNTNGSLDNSFDTDGIVSTLIGSQSEATSVVLQPDGKIILGGHAVTGVGWDFALARYNSNGSLDNSFDSDGILTKNINGDDFCYAMKLSSDRIYVGGVSNQVVFTLLAFQTGAITLPLQLTNFNAFKQHNYVLLNWQTASEQNTSHFDIEHSNNGNSFSAIGRVQANGNSTYLKNYSFTHQQSIAGVNYYRLKMFDADGHFTFSNVVTVRMNGIIGMEVFPNPVQDVLQVQVTASQNGNILLQIRDAAGKIVKQQKITFFGTCISTTINVSMLAKGVYYLVVKRENNESIKEFIKE